MKTKLMLAALFFGFATFVLVDSFGVERRDQAIAIFEVADASVITPKGDQRVSLAGEWRAAFENPYPTSGSHSTQRIFRDISDAIGQVLRRLGGGK